MTRKTRTAPPAADTAVPDVGTDHAAPTATDTPTTPTGDAAAPDAPPAAPDAPPPAPDALPPAPDALPAAPDAPPAADIVPPAPAATPPAPVRDIPPGFVTVDHDDPGASVGFGGATYTRDADGLLVVPVSILAHILPHGFRLPPDAPAHGA